MKIKAMAVGLVVTFSTQIFAQERVSENNLNQAMCVLSHVRNAVQAQVNQLDSPNAADANVALDILDKYKSDPNYVPGSVIATVGDVVSIAALYSFWKRNRFFSWVDELQNSKTYFYQIRKILNGSNGERTLALLYAENLGGESGKILNGLLDPKMNLVTDMTVLNVYEKIPELQKDIAELRSILPDARQTYLESLEHTDLVARVNYCRGSESFVRATKIIDNLNFWTANPKNSTILLNAIKSTLTPESYVKVTTEFRDLNFPKQVFAAEAEDLGPATLKWSLSAKAMGVLGAVAIATGIAYEVFAYYHADNQMPDFLTMDPADLRNYLSNHPDDVVSIISYANELGCQNP